MRLSTTFVALSIFGLAVLPPAPARAGRIDHKLEIYWIDVEGGGATLLVTPAGESILIDAGNPGDRDAGRIHKTATTVAGLQKIDHLIVTHYHNDHFGGVADLGRLMPIGTLYENGIDTAAPAERNSPQLNPYRSAKVGNRVQIAPGAELALAHPPGGLPVILRFLGARQSFATAKGARSNALLCKDNTQKEADTSDNANSVVTLVQQGNFRFFDGGDLTWNKEADLVCPTDRAGAVDVYQTDHHGLAISNNPTLLRTLQPTVAVFNNGPKKGGEPQAIAAVRGVSSVKAIYQLHRNVRTDATMNSPADMVANKDEACAGEFIKLVVDAKATAYTVSVPSTGHSKTYQTQRRK